MIEHIAFEILIYTATICFICWLRYEPHAGEEYPKPLPKHQDLKAYKAMTIRQLKKLASKRKIKNYGSMTKNQLIEALA